MKTILLSTMMLCIITAFAQDAATILKKVDDNMLAQNRVFKSEMTIHSKRGSRTITSLGYAEGTSKSFTEYLSPASEKGTKMLKLDNHLWIYSPSTDRIIQISGHMLRQSVMGSDLSYEDMMDDRKLTDIYYAVLIEKINDAGQEVYLLELDAIVEDVAYHKQKIWVDAVRFVPLRQEMYAKSGKLLKQVEMSDIQQVGKRWFPMTVRYKDVLKQGDGTIFKLLEVQFDQEIPEHIFSKASLRK